MSGPEKPVFVQFLDAAQLLPVDPLAVTALFELLRSFDGERMRINAAELDRLERRDAATRMLASGAGRTVTRDHLVEMFGVSEKTAYEDIAEVIRANSAPPLSGF